MGCTSVRFGYSYEMYQPPLHYVALAWIGTTASTDDMIPQWCYYWRIFSIMLATPVIPLSYALMRLMIGKRQDWAIIVPAITALSPGFVYYNSVLTNSALETSLAASILYVTARWPRQGEPTWGEATTLG